MSQSCGSACGIEKSPLGNLVDGEEYILLSSSHLAWQHRILEEDVDVTKVEQPRPIFLALKCNIDVMTRDLNEFQLLVIIPSLPLCHPTNYKALSQYW